jgi:hypothetical protein
VIAAALPDPAPGGFINNMNCGFAPTLKNYGPQQYFIYPKQVMTISRRPYLQCGPAAEAIRTSTRFIVLAGRVRKPGGSNGQGLNPMITMPINAESFELGFILGTSVYAVIGSAAYILFLAGKYLVRFGTSLQRRLVRARRGLELAR